MSRPWDRDGHYGGLVEHWRVNGVPDDQSTRDAAVAMLLKLYGEYRALVDCLDEVLGEVS